MQQATPSIAPAEGRTAAHKTVLMCRPEHFTVSYVINPWMDPSKPTSTELALAQWQTLHDAYRSLGYTVEFVDPIAGLDDMVYAANGGFTLDGKAYGAKFTYEQRVPEGPAYMAWFADNGFDVHEPEHVNEGEGDMLLSRGAILAGHGFRTSLESHEELRRIFDREVVSLRLVDPRFYHLDTALAVLDERTIAYFPGAFSAASNAALRHLFPGSILATEDDAVAFGLNAMSDGLNVVLSEEAVGLQEQLRAHGFNPVGLDMSELRKAGGSAKCCTLELRA